MVTTTMKTHTRNAIHAHGTGNGDDHDDGTGAKVKVEKVQNPKITDPKTNTKKTTNATRAIASSLKTLPMSGWQKMMRNTRLHSSHFGSRVRR